MFFSPGFFSNRDYCGIWQPTKDGFSTNVIYALMWILGMAVEASAQFIKLAPFFFV
jgi:hypothetical protein